MSLIKCPECGNDVSNKAIACPHCGCPITDKGNAEEKIIMSGLCNRVKNIFLVQNGSALLTTKRFVYMKHSLPKTFVMGAFVNLTKGSFDFDIPIEKISSLEDGRQGVSKTIIINTTDGEKYNFYFTKREEWKIAINNLIKK